MALSPGLPLSAPSSRTRHTHPSVTHDDLGRLVQAFIDGEAVTGLPRGAAFEAFRRRHDLSASDFGRLRKVLAIVEHPRMRRDR